MRIVGGSLRGRRYDASVPAGVRPTADSLRETIFNILRNYIDADSCRVADVCAGTGFMGFEAISRGAAYVEFIEKSRAAAAFIQKVSGHFSILSNRFKIVNSEALRYLGSIVSPPADPYNIIFIDPPYSLNVTDNLTNKIISKISEKKLLATDGVIVAETSGSSRIIVPEGMDIQTERLAGETRIAVVMYKQ